MEIMDNLEIILLLCLFFAIVFKILKILKYFLILCLLLITFKFFGGFENQHFQDFDTKYKISETLKSWGKSINIDGLINETINGVENKFEERIKNHKEVKEKEKTEKELERVN